jgi:DNA-binding response OmpR family regulator
LVFLDIAMPDMSGLEVLQRLRISERCKDLPVYMLTARADDLAVTESRKCGASGFLTKPFAISEVREVVNEVLAGAVPPPSEQ